MIGATINYADGTTRDAQGRIEVIAGVVTFALEPGLPDKPLASIEFDEVQLSGSIWFATSGDAA